MSSLRPVRPDWVELPLGDHVLAECPRWDAARQCLSWVDVLGGTVGTARWREGSWVDVEHRAFGRMPTAAEPLPDGAMAVAVDGLVCRVQPDGVVTQRVAVSPDFPRVRTNDTTLDQEGRLLVGLFTEDRVSARGGVVRVDLEADSVTPVVQGLVTANGLAVTPGGEYLYAVDTARGTLSRHRLGGGHNAGQVLVAHPGPGVLDGIVLGPDGDIWVAVWDAGALHRYDRGGHLREVLAGPVSRPSAMAVVDVAGSPHLVVTTARSRRAERCTSPSAAPAGVADGSPGSLEPSPEGRLYATALPD